MSITVTAVCSVRRDWSEDVSHLLKNSVKGAGIPDSNLDEDFTAKVVIYDNAGNTRTLPLQLFRYDNYLGGPRSAKLRQRGAGVSGYPAYSAGMTVNENPIHLVYRAKVQLPVICRGRPAIL